MSKPTLIFVYNADSGFVNTLLDIGHKIVSPKTYSCNLCAITHSTFSMRDEWKNFVAGLGVSVEFLHRDELEKQYGMRDVGLPAVFRKNNGALEAWVTREEINRCHSLGELERLVRDRLRAEA
ncbi:MAG: hypothetical protein A2W42_03925 [Candidatus Muproteobacteria bacterium RIFCSPHIGHO2_01_60_12]|nr:MAG: hypothetical protein A2W42_03925 [Candidatus Muproteobacteria bacterium RIFCSPHIGHO2_01_60_12]